MERPKHHKSRREMALRGAQRAVVLATGLVLTALPGSAADLMLRAGFDDGSAVAQTAGGDANPIATDEETGDAVDLRAPINLADRDFRLLEVAW